MTDYFIKGGTEAAVKEGLTQLGYWDTEQDIARELTFIADPMVPKLKNAFQGSVVAINYFRDWYKQTGVDLDGNPIMTRELGYYLILRTLGPVTLPDNLPGPLEIVPLEQAPVRWA